MCPPVQNNDTALSSRPTGVAYVDHMTGEHMDVSKLTYPAPVQHTRAHGPPVSEVTLHKN